MAANGALRKLMFEVGCFRFLPDTVEEVGSLPAVGWADSIRSGGSEWSDDGGTPGPQDALFYEFLLERHVPERHLLRSIDRFVELDGLRQEWLRSTARWGGHRSIRNC